MCSKLQYKPELPLEDEFSQRGLHKFYRGSWDLISSLLTNWITPARIDELYGELHGSYVLEEQFCRKLLLLLIEAYETEHPAHCAVAINKDSLEHADSGFKLESLRVELEESKTELRNLIALNREAIITFLEHGPHNRMD